MNAIQTDKTISGIPQSSKKFIMYFISLQLTCCLMNRRFCLLQVSHLIYRCQGLHFQTSFPERGNRSSVQTCSPLDLVVNRACGGDLFNPAINCFSLLWTAFIFVILPNYMRRGIVKVSEGPCKSIIEWIGNQCFCSLISAAADNS